MTAGLEYLTNKQATLEANNNMTPTFMATFTADKNAFNALHQEFLDSEETARQGTEAKIMANNNIHTSLMSMLLDGQEIFKKQDVIRKQFVFSDLLYLVSGSGIAGLKGTVTNKANGEVLENVLVSIQGTTKETTTSTDGRYNISPVPAGTYNIVFTIDGYQQLIIEEQKINTGTVSTGNAEMSPL